MKIKLWDVLSILGLLATCGVAAVVLSIFNNPNSTFNFFPPPTEIPTVDIPTATPTKLKMPATWTPTNNFQITATLAETQTPLPSSTSFVLPSYTPSNTVTNTPTDTPEATMTYTPGSDQVQEIGQTPQDGVILSPGEDFDLRWEVKNIGTNDWNTDYYYEYQSGVEGSGPSSYKLKEAVDDGDTITLIVDMLAPSSSGSYKSTWVLKNDDGDVMKTLIFAFSVQ